MATLAQWEASLIGRPAAQATTLSGCAVAMRDQLLRGIPFATAQTAVANEARHYKDLNKWNEYAPFLALTGP